MKTILLGLLFSVLVVGNGFADVTGQVVGSAQDQNGNIVVKVAYTIDGVNEQTQYPMEDGKYVQVFRLSFQNIDGMTQEQIGAYIDKNVEDHCKNLLTRKATAIENAKLDLNPYVGRTVTVANADVQISETKAYTMSTAGKVSEKTLTVEPPAESMDSKIEKIKGDVEAIKTGFDIVAVDTVKTLQVVSEVE